MTNDSSSAVTDVNRAVHCDGLIRDASPEARDLARVARIRRAQADLLEKAKADQPTDVVADCERPTPATN